MTDEGLVRETKGLAQSHKTGEAAARTEAWSRALATGSGTASLTTSTDPASPKCAIVTTAEVLPSDVFPQDQAAKDKALQSMATMSSAQIISATAFHSKMALTRGPGYPAVSGVSGAAWSQGPHQLSPSHSSPF